MKIKRMWLFLMVFVLLSGSLSVLAQDDGTEMQEFVSEDNLLTLQYPLNWFAKQDEDTLYPMVTIANSEDLLERTEEDEDMIAGDAMISLVIWPTEVLAMFGGELPDNYELMDIALAIQEMFSSDEDGMGWGEPEVVPLTMQPTDEEEATEVEIISIAATDATGEGMFYIYEADGLILLVAPVAYPGEFTEELAALTLEVMATVNYDSTVEELMEIIMNPPDDEEEEWEEPTPVVLPTYTPVATATGHYPTYSEVLATLPADAELVTTDATIESIRSDSQGTLITYGDEEMQRCGSSMTDWECYGAKFTLLTDSVYQGVFYPAGSLFTIDIDHNLVPVSSWD